MWTVASVLCAQDWIEELCFSPEVLSQLSTIGVDNGISLAPSGNAGI